MLAAMLPRPVLLAFLAILAATTPAWALEKWLYYPTNLLPDENLPKLEAVWKRAAAAGYTKVLLTDSKFAHLEEMGGPNFPKYFPHIEQVKKIAAELKLEIVPALFSVGYSNDLLGLDPNLIEAIPVKGVPLIVQGGVGGLHEGAARGFQICASRGNGRAELPKVFPAHRAGEENRR